MEVAYWFELDSNRTFDVVSAIMVGIIEGMCGYSEGMDIHWFMVK
jgi:hypothetical protein